MKFIRTLVVVVLIAAAAGWICRQWLFINLVTYKISGKRTDYLVYYISLEKKINQNAAFGNPAGIKEIIKLCHKITSDHLEFTTAPCSSDPKKLFYTQKANCIGYAAFFTTCCNYLLSKSGLAGSWVAIHRVGKLYFFGLNLHQFFKSAFFRDHDFVTIENRTTGEVIAVDPVLADYLQIPFIMSAK